MLHPIPLALLISLIAITNVAAQTAPTGTEGFGSLAGRQAVIIVDDAGVETTGRLLRLSVDELTISAGGRDRTFARRDVAAIYKRGDSMKNGAGIGGLSGAALGFLAGTQSTCGDFWTGLHSCSVGEKVANGMFGAAIIGAVGAAIGVGIDAIVIGRTVLYERPKSPSSRALTIAPVLSPSRGSVGIGVSW